jgi:hypothetical protein
LGKVLLGDSRCGLVWQTNPKESARVNETRLAAPSPIYKNKRAKAVGRMYHFMAQMNVRYHGWVRSR